MILICESCCHEIEPDEPYVMLRSLVGKDAEGRPLWGELHLHHYDPESKCCKTLDR